MLFTTAQPIPVASMGDTMDLPGVGEHFLLTGRPVQTTSIGTTCTCRPYPSHGIYNYAIDLTRDPRRSYVYASPDGVPNPDRWERGVDQQAKENNLRRKPLTLEEGVSHSC